MLKRLLLVTVAIIGVTAASYGQGTVIFDNGSVGARTLLSPTGTPGGFATAGGYAPTGMIWAAQLYTGPAATAEGSLTAAGTRVQYRTGLNGGNVETRDTITNPFTGAPVNAEVAVVATGGAAATIQMRAWDAQYTSWEAAEAANGIRGKSPLLALAKTGIGGAGGTPGEALTGLQAFTIVVPEPSTIALGALGLAALLFRRRK